MKIFDTSQIPDLDALPSYERELIYCGLDTMITNEVRDNLLLETDSLSLATYNTSRLFLGPAFDLMKRGFLIDTKARDEVVAELSQRKDTLNAYLQELAFPVWKKPLNYNSPLQMKSFFYDHLFIPTQYETKKGERKISTGRGPLEKIERNYPLGTIFARIVMRLRDHDKVLSTMTQGLLDGRWHASFNVAGTDTFRWSSSKHPLNLGSNLQNIDDEIRRIFVADPGWILFSIDQQGAEARGVAYITGDEAYIKAVESGDVHTTVASMVWGFKPLRELSDRTFYRDLSYRDVSKKFTHGSSYYGKPRTLAIQARTPIALVEEFQSNFFKNFPGIQKWHSWTDKQLQSKGYLITAYGDRRQFWGKLNDDSTLRSAIAFQPQHIVGKLTAVALYRIWSELPHDKVQILNNGHDAVIGQIKKEYFDALMPSVLQCLDNPLDVVDIHGKSRRMSIPWEASYGANWGKVKFDKKTSTTINPKGLRDYKGKLDADALHW